MTIPRLAEMTNYWNNNPPVHILVAAYMGVEPKKKAKAITDQGSFNELLAGVPTTW